jgi:hypothetical protein
LTSENRGGQGRSERGVPLGTQANEDVGRRRFAAVKADRICYRGH